MKKDCFILFDSSRNVIVFDAKKDFNSVVVRQLMDGAKLHRKLWKKDFDALIKEYFANKGKMEIDDNED